jgi:hypothetical protein
MIKKQILSYLGNLKEREESAQVLQK